MSDTFDLLNVAWKVFTVLTEKPCTRDDDKLLLIEIWSKESQAITVNDLFVELMNGDLSHFESVRRMRQKIQEKHPSLRGEKWDVRHNMEGAFCEQLTFFDKW